MSQPSSSSPNPTNDPDAIRIEITTNDGLHQVRMVSREALPTIQAALDYLPTVEERDRDTSPKRTRVPPLPAITSGHQTRLPGTESFQVITQSFGTGIEKQPSLWPEGGGIELITPTGVLHIEGNTLTENNALQQYVARELGPEGLKHLAGLLDVYLLLTQGRSQKQDIQVTAKQVLQRIGREGHADDRDEQIRLLNTALYLARTFVSSLSSSRSTQKRYSPLLVLESVTTGADESISFEYHLGQEFFEAISGSKLQHYTIPTARVVGYHSVKSQHELLLTFYLGNRLALGAGTCSMYFVTLCTQSAIYALAELQRGERGKNRTRNAQQVIYALERMEQDGLIRREPHPDIDTVVAVNACLDPRTEEQLAPATLARLKGMIRSLRGFQTKDLNTKRRIVLQRLLNVEASREEVPYEAPEFCTRLTFSAGSLLLRRQEEQAASTYKEMPVSD